MKNTCLPAPEDTTVHWLAVLLCLIWATSHLQNQCCAPQTQEVFWRHTHQNKTKFNTESHTLLSNHCCAVGKGNKNAICFTSYCTLLKFVKLPFDEPQHQTGLPHRWLSKQHQFELADFVASIGPIGSRSTTPTCHNLDAPLLGKDWNMFQTREPQNNHQRHQKWVKESSLWLQRIQI